MAHVNNLFIKLNSNPAEILFKQQFDNLVPPIYRKGDWIFIGSDDELYHVDDFAAKFYKDEYHRDCLNHNVYVTKHSNKEDYNATK